MGAATDDHDYAMIYPMTTGFSEKGCNFSMEAFSAPFGMASPGDSCYQTSLVSGAMTASTTQRFQPLGHVISEQAKNC